MDDNSCVMKLIEIAPVDNGRYCSELDDVKLSPSHIKVCAQYLFSVLFCSFAQGSSLLWTCTVRPFYDRSIALTQEGRNLVNDVCECV